MQARKGRLDSKTATARTVVYDESRAVLLTGLRFVDTLLVRLYGETRDGLLYREGAGHWVSVHRA